MDTPNTWSFYSSEIFRTTKNALNDLLIEDVKILPESILGEGRQGERVTFVKVSCKKKKLQKVF